MKKKLQMTALLLLTSVTMAFGQQVGIGTDSPHASAILELDVSDYATNNKKGFLPPRMTTAERPVNPAEGLVIYNLDEHCLEFWNAGEWVSFCKGSGTPTDPPTPLNYRLGGSGNEDAYSMQHTTDGGYILAGVTTSSASGDVTGTSKGGFDIWVVKLKADGTIDWQKNYGGTGDEEAYSIQQTTDGGYILAGYTTSSASGDVTGVNKGIQDIWVLKLNATGTIQWQKNYGGSGEDNAWSIQQTTDGGYILTGETYSSASGDVTGVSKGSVDFWVVKLNATGTIQWQKNYGGSGEDRAFSIQETTDGGYILAGYTRSSASGDVTGANNGDFDFWVVKLNATGTIQWQKNYGGSWSDQAKSIQQTPDGGYILTGRTLSSASGDVTGASKGSSDVWVVKLNATGTIQWQKNYGGSGEDQAWFIQLTADGGYILTAYTRSSASGDVTGANNGDFDIWVVKLNVTGTIQWQKNYGGNSYDINHCILQNPDGGYIVAGNSSHNSAGNGDQVGLISRGTRDIWVFRIDANGNIIQ